MRERTKVTDEAIRIVKRLSKSETIEKTAKAVNLSTHTVRQIRSGAYDKSDKIFIHGDFYKIRKKI